MEGGKGKANVRKRGCSSSSSPSSLMAPNYRLKRTFLMGKRRGATTPVPAWKVPSHSQLLGNDGQTLISCLNVEAAGDLSVSARKLAAVYWEIDRLHSPRLKMGAFQGRRCEKDRILESSMLRSASDPYQTTVSEGMLDPTKLCRCRRKESADCRKLLRPTTNLNLRSSNSIPSFFAQVNEAEINGQRNNLKDVYNGLKASKQLLEVLSCVCNVKQIDCTTTTLVSALRAELDRSCDRVSGLIRGQKMKRSDADAVPSVVGELEMERKLRRRGEKLNKKTEAELAEARASLAMAMKELESEKKARRKVEQVCEELAQGIWELKRQFAKVGEEVEKEREMFHLADLLREERVQMKLSEAKCLYEEQNAVVDKLRNELAACLEGRGGSFRLDRSNEAERDSGEAVENQDEGGEKNAAVNGDDEEESDDSDVEPIEFSFLWGNAGKVGSKREERICISEEDGKEIISSTMEHRVMQENQEFFARIRCSEFT